MTRWVDWALGRARDARHPTRVERSAEPLPREEFVWDGSFHWGEWCEPKQRAEDCTPIDPVASNPMAWFMADKGEVGTAYLFRSTRTLASAAEVLGRRSEDERYAGIAEQVRAAWQTEFLDGADRPQAFYVRALAFDLVPDHLRARFAEELVTLIRAAGFYLGTGFLSTADCCRPIPAMHSTASNHFSRPGLVAYLPDAPRSQRIPVHRVADQLGVGHLPHLRPFLEYWLAPSGDALRWRRHAGPTSAA